MHSEINATLCILTALLHRELSSFKLSSIKLFDCNGSVFGLVELNEGKSALHHDFTNGSTAREVTLQILASGRARETCHVHLRVGALVAHISRALLATASTTALLTWAARGTLSARSTAASWGVAMAASAAGVLSILRLSIVKA